MLGPMGKRDGEAEVRTVVVKEPCHCGRASERGGLGASADSEPVLEAPPEAPRASRHDPCNSSEILVTGFGGRFGNQARIN